jgi:hypothetical protein
VYFLRAGIKEDPKKRWALPDRIFFGHGACHILAGVHLAEFPNSGFRAMWIRPKEGYSGNHILLEKHGVAFDFHGYSDFERLVRRHRRGWNARFAGWSASIEPVRFDLLNTTELNDHGMRGPDQYLGDPIGRARSFLLRFRHGLYLEYEQIEARA